MGWELSAALCPLQFHCCGSNNSQDWRDSEWIRSREAGGRVVPDSCCKTVVAHCGQRDHASNIYKVEVGGRGLGCQCGMLRIGWPRPAGSLGLQQWGAGGLACLQRPHPHPPGRLHHQAGDLHPGAPEGHRGRGHRHCLRAGGHIMAGRVLVDAGDTKWLVVETRSSQLYAAGVRHDLHVLPVQEPEAGALLTHQQLAFVRMRARSTTDPAHSWPLCTCVLRLLTN